MFRLFTFLMLWKYGSFANYTATAQGTASVHLVYKEGFDVTNMEINGNESVPSRVSIVGIPNSEMNVSWQDNTVVKDKNGREIVVEFEQPKTSRVEVGSDAKANVDIMPKQNQNKNLKGDFTGDYNLNFIY